MDSGICSSSKAANQPKPTNLGINSSQLGSSLAARADEMHNLYQCAVLVISPHHPADQRARCMIVCFSRMSGPIAPARISASPT